jgi:hypothetical protein
MSPTLIVGFLALALAAAALFQGSDPAGPVPAVGEALAAAKGKQKKSPAAVYPSRGQIRAAKRFAASRGGSVAFAVIGPDRKRKRAGKRGKKSKVSLHGRSPRMQFSSASVSKAMLLAAYLRSHRQLSASAKGTLAPMIQVSDNDAAGSIYSQVGDSGLRRVARRAGMRDFEPTPGFWGGAQITAADMARFFYRLEDNLGKRHRKYGMKLLGSVDSSQRWGVPEGAGKGWSIWFKGGWRPGGGESSSGAVTHQAALLRHRDGTRIALAVLTNQAPGDGGGYGTLEGIASRLTSPAP